MVPAFRSIVKLKFGNHTSSRHTLLKILRVIYRTRQTRISIPGIFALRRSNLKVQKYPMPKQNFYAVQHGRATGVYLTWSECEEQVKQFPRAVFKKFNTAEEAEAFVRDTQPTPTKKPPSGTKRNISSVVDETKCIVVYSDGACKGNGKVGSIAGIGVFFGPNDPRNLAERCPGDQTNNRAELIAIIRALETVPVSSQKIVIKTDSKYSIQCIGEWLPNWIKNGFRTREDGPVKNVGILKYLAALLDERANRGQPVALQHVKGHSGNPGNDGADAQANIGATLPPRPDLDWEALEASVHQTIDVLIQATDEQKATASGGTDNTESPLERPAKMPKHSHESPEADMPSSLFNKLAPKTETRVCTLSPQPLLALSPRHSTDHQPTEPTSNGQATSRFPLVQAPSTFPRQQHTNSSTANHEGLAASSPHNQGLKLEQETELSASLNLPSLKASRISPPLVPVSPNDIDPNMYQDCLLEGEEWAKEIQSL